MKFMTLVLVMGLAAAANAGETKARQVIGGDVIYSAQATGATQDEAVFKAESQAVRMIMIECAIPHRDTKVFDFAVNPRGGKFVASVSAGLPLESCEEGRRANAEQRATLSNPMLLASQKVYEESLEGRVQPLKQQAPLAKPTPAQQQEYRVRVTYSKSFLQGYERYLNAKVDTREQLRAQMRQQGSF